MLDFISGLHINLDGSCNHIIILLLDIDASDFIYTHLSFDWAESFNKVNGALSCIPLMYFLWATPYVSYYFHFYKDCVQLFDKLLQALVGFHTNQCL